MLDSLIEESERIFKEVKRLEGEINEYTSLSIRIKTKIKDRNIIIKEKLEEAQRNQQERDLLNKIVSDLKNQRNELKQIILSNSKELSLLKEEREKIIEKIALQLKDWNREYKKIHGSLKHLERKIETSVLTRQRENKLVEEANNLRIRLKELENAVALQDKIMMLRKKNKELREKEQKLYIEMVERVDLANEHHKKMQRCYQEINESRNITKKLKNDLSDVERKIEILRKHINENKNDYSIASKKIHEIRIKEETKMKEEREKELRVEAEKILENFKKGKKLSTDEFLLLKRFELL